MNQRTSWIAVIVIFLISSTAVLLYTESTQNFAIHVIGTFIAFFLSILSFKAYFSYKIIRALFSAVAFLIFGIVQGIELVNDIEYHDNPVDEIRDFAMIIGLSLFAIATIPKKEK
jgi:hypothetical protein